jgi:hypothetical protein
MPFFPGSNGKQEYFDTTPWKRWLSHHRVSPERVMGTPRNNQAVAEITAMFLAAGADPTQDIPDWVLLYLSDHTRWGRLTIPRDQLLRALEVLREKKVVRE